MKPWIVALIAIGACIVIAVALLSGSSEFAEQVRMPLLAVVSIIAILATLAFISTLFQSAGLHDTNHALALPDGSVRAFIALSLIVVFTVITLFVLARFSDTRCIPCEEKPTTIDTAAKAPAGPTDTTGTPSASGTVAPSGTDSTVAPPATDTTGTITRENAAAEATAKAAAAALKATADAKTAADAKAAADAKTAGAQKRQDAADDLAKQLLTMLGTLLAAVSSFYFGASTTASATDPTKVVTAIRAMRDLDQNR
jgi:hypothetical protein